MCDLQETNAKLGPVTSAFDEEIKETEDQTWGIQTGFEQGEFGT